MWKCVFCVAWLCATNTTPPALAQGEPLSVMEGDRVRVVTSRFQGRYFIAALSRDTLTLRGAASASKPIIVPLNSGVILEIGSPRPRGAGALRGAGIGLLTGAVGGAMIGLASGDDPPGFLSFTATQKAGLLGLALGGAGVVVGSLVGLAVPGARWQRVDPPQRLRVSPRRDGGVGLTYSHSF